ncbi:RNase H family protein [Raineyella sp. LH-20]|uniref:RNase H family protein n=1 Tax=Raineyella sp. LH-20 TaxID=3081204 RepID=UPI0029557EF1|nr:RNase H family protein [Raineyella sp. LH-20]WOP17528.1 RNase H family protein [Raineyella sp. LH-20]
MTITAAADGSSLGNPGPAGWAWYVDDDCWASGGWPRGTNNMGELMAVLDLLHQTAHVDEPLHVLCDSQYAINVISKWTKGWKKKGWKKADGKPVLNVDLVKALDEAMQGRDVTFEWVRGHNGHSLNEAADTRARAAATAYQQSREPDPGPGYPTAGAAVRSAAVRSAAVRSAAVRSGGEEQDESELEEDYLQPDLFSGAEPELDLPEIDQVAELERWLHSAEPAEDPTQWAGLLHPGWFRVRADGTLDHRGDVLSGVLSPDVCSLDILEARRLRADEVLLLSRATQATTATLRTALWVRENTQWQQRFEQVTPEL